MDGIYRRRERNSKMKCEIQATQDLPLAGRDDVMKTETEPVHNLCKNNRPEMSHNSEKKRRRGSLQRGYRGFDVKRKISYGGSPAKGQSPKTVAPELFQELPHLHYEANVPCASRTDKRDLCQMGEVPYMSSVTSCTKDGRFLCRNGEVSDGMSFSTIRGDTDISVLAGTTRDIPGSAATVVLKMKTVSDDIPDSSTPRFNAGAQNCEASCLRATSLGCNTSNNMSRPMTGGRPQNGTTHTYDNVYPPAVSPSYSFNGTRGQRLPICHYIFPYHASPPFRAMRNVFIDSQTVMDPSRRLPDVYGDIPTDPRQKVLKGCQQSGTIFEPKLEPPEPICSGDILDDSRPTLDLPSVWTYSPVYQARTSAP